MRTSAASANFFKRTFLIYLGGGNFRLADENEEIEFQDELESRFDPEAVAKEIMEEYFGVKLEKRKLNIFGKYKEFDLVNVEEAIVGDVKHYTFKG